MSCYNSQCNERGFSTQFIEVLTLREDDYHDIDHPEDDIEGEEDHIDAVLDHKLLNLN
jgi:hypothetical protein